MNRYSLRAVVLMSMTLVSLAPAGAHAAAGPPPGPHIDLSNVRLPDAAANLGQSPLLTAFGAACDGTTDDAAAFAAATAWLAVRPNRIVTVPAKVCATSATVTLGDGRQRSTTLTAGAGGSSLSVATCIGVLTGDAVGVKRDDGSLFTTTTTGCTGTTLSLAASYSGGAAASGNVVFTGKVSSYSGGGIRGIGAGMDEGEFPGGATVSTIKYIGAAAPTTTLGAQANATDRTLTVASIADISLGTAIGIDLNDGSRFWTWADRMPSGTSVHLGNEIPSTASNGSTVTIASNPVVRIAGPIASPVFEGVRLDANNLAAIGLEAVHPVGGKFRGPSGIKATGYTALGHYVHSAEFYAGSAIGIGDNDFQLYARMPANDKTVGCWFRGTAAQNVAFSRNRFHGGECMMGGHDSRAAGILVEFLDNNTFIKPYTQGNGSGLGAGLYRQPSVGKALFPGGNVYIAPALVGGVKDGSATGGSLGVETLLGYSVGDGEPIPTSATLAGTILETGVPIGLSTPKDHFAGLTLSKLSDAQVLMGPGSTSDATNKTVLVVPTDCAPGLNVSGDRGLDSASARLPDTWYGVFVIGNYVDGTTSCMFAQTTAAAVPSLVLPAAFTFSAYVGRFKTDASSNVDVLTILPRGQFYIDATGDSAYTPGASGFRPRAVRLLACGGGGSGGSGARQVSGTVASGGVGGSAGGCMDLTYPVEQLSATVNVTVGAGGAAANPPGTNSTAGNPGNNGNPTFFGASAATAYAYGGAGCSGDGGRLNANAASGGSGAGAPNTAGGVSGCTSGTAGAPGFGMTGGGIPGTNSGAGGSPLGAGVGSPGGASTTASAFTGGTATGRFGCAGGGSGGGITAAASIGGLVAGFAQDSGTGRGIGGTSGSPNGGNGFAPLYPWLPGSGGGGGYGNFSGAGGDGGAATQCAGGGGGGTAVNGNAAGSGGKGGDGYAFVWERR